MTTTYDPDHPRYYSESDLRGELERVFDLCHGCRLCFNLCPSFPTLFGFVDDLDGQVDKMTTIQQDQVVSECYQCKLCYVKCPYVPPHEWALDFPRMIMRANAIAGQTMSWKDRVTNQALGNTDLVGRISSVAAPVVNREMTSTGSPARKVVERLVGISSKRSLPTYSRRRFSRWFSSRTPQRAPGGPGGLEPQARASIYPTCFVEYMNPEIGMDLVGVFEHNNVECSLPDSARCCGAPWLHSGEVDKFKQVARKNLSALQGEIEAGRDIVVAQPTCAYVLKKDYPQYVKSTLAEEVSARVFEPSEYLNRLKVDPDKELATDFSGQVPESVVYHVACHHQALNAGVRARDLLKLAGVKVTIVPKCSGIDGTWGYRKANYDESKKVGKILTDALKAELGKVAESQEKIVIGDCHLANTAIAEDGISTPLHPMEVLARAYGLPRG